MKSHKEMLGAIRRGDKVVTGGGIIGTVTRVVDDHELSVEISKGVRVKVQRGTISAIIAKTEPAKGAAKGGGGGSKEPNAEGPVTRSGGAASGLKALLGGKDR